MYKIIGKRILDIGISLIFILCFFWLYILLWFLIKIKLGSPVIFKQERPGLNGKVFTMYKYRSMTEKKDENGNLLSDKDRLTSFGKSLRASSLDEIPELWNVLKGDMSFVGPRPLLVEYLSKYSSEQMRRHEVKPGITGYAQVNGRNNTTWEERFKNDLYYVNNISLILDIKIIIQTFLKVLNKSDINQSENETMRNFMNEER
ncbi:Undecaprenyl phosphate N,N'-diacetylbacillosamine 1-phosphate transferase [Fusobacterium necrophorum]|uniref:sugar transferase n=1 Tax=Fusobacterium necrophorum TaxID=859 RepID=UPI000461ADF0|nr:sugar transferase [Fusobacterium necrophorum]KDE61884.1 UDP-galactose phosphate transferase [Fusobacterium necrophorum BFTR-1]MBR8734796.1 Undecaprenyl phosphate N,N'-diacetylbacillosamine 1-phosphate transferase [Fusobacterium necrophorum]MBR8790966.1 Undecaprenyl phosphate N,N'-diacetylbacillosamine 1-phosphate transferase [Fusobacterium necrophorum]MCF0161641.1 sugar transferase [Fusobacterium necrophorum]